MLNMGASIYIEQRKGHRISKLGIVKGKDEVGIYVYAPQDIFMNIFERNGRILLSWGKWRHHPLKGLQLLIA
jgi:hypothetical protein